jgi:hypothetical protein
MAYFGLWQGLFVCGE